MKQPDLQDLFIADVTEAMRKSRPMLASSDPNTRADGDFAQGMAVGLRGQWRLLMGHWIDAYFDGHKSLRFLRACLASDPAYYDADLGLGIYDYEAARFGRKIKMGFLFKIFGDERRGIRRIGLAKEKGRYSRRQAAVFLLTLYIQDKKDYRDALPLAQELRRNFPQSPYFEFVQAMLDYDSGFKDESFDLGADLFRKLEKDPAVFKPKILSLACSFSGSSCLNKRQMSSFMDWINGSIEKFYGNHSQKNWITALRLLRGYSEGALGETAQADGDFHGVLTAPDFMDFHARAEQCLAVGCDRQSILADLKKLAAGSSNGRALLDP
ncbi:MAG TPA: hypothetical protein VNK24_00020 [Elusimicrobiota bacterium]|nr:hypothetical protein [Elusimicrobiota bacterium]